MKYQKTVILLIIFLHGIMPSSGNSRLIVVENAKSLQSFNSDINYPLNNQTIDVIWLFPHSIRLTVDDFHLNVHEGDFLLISEYPLLNEATFKDKNNTNDGSYVDQLAKSIITEQGLLLSGKVEKNIEVINPDGTFVLFHTEAKGFKTPPSHFKGFDIPVINYDDLLTTTTIAPPDKEIIPVEGQEIYISKFLSCMEPLKFVEQIPDFKGRVAKIATDYCNETGIVLENGDIQLEEVNIPDLINTARDRAGVHYCDKTWPYYLTCVEVTFAINRMNDTGHYVLHKDILEDMWEKKSEELRQFNYCPFTPPREPENLLALGWITFFLGVILALIAIFGIALFRLTDTRKILDAKVFSIGKKDTTTTELDGRAQPTFWDPDNPYLKFIKGRAYINPQEELYPPPNHLLQNDADAPDAFKRNSAKKNPNFQTGTLEVHAYNNMHAYNNPDFRSDNAEDVLLSREQHVDAIQPNTSGSSDLFILKRTHAASFSET